MDALDASAQLLEAARSLAERPKWMLRGGELDEVAANIAAAMSALEAGLADLAGEAEMVERPREVGARTTTKWLAQTTRLNHAHCLRIVKLGRSLDQRLAPTRLAWIGGQVTIDQAMVIVETLELVRNHPAFESIQTDLIGYAGQLEARELKIVANRMIEVRAENVADEQLALALEREEQRAEAQTRLEIGRPHDGVVRGSFVLPTLDGQMLQSLLEGLASPRRASDLDDGTAHLEHAQRMGRAFCELLNRYPTDGIPDHGGVPATLVVTIEEDKLRDGLATATLSTGDKITADEARRLACEVGIIPMVLGGTGPPLNVGAKRRLFDARQRAALAHRDKGCVFPGCDRPPAWTEAHHITPWSQGGPTTVENGCLLCHHHHRVVHRDHWHLLVAPDGVIEVLAPPHLDPTQTRRRHARFIHVAA